MNNKFRFMATVSAFALAGACTLAQAYPKTLTATSMNEQSVKSFTVHFDDTNNNNLFEFSELVSFSGLSVLGNDYDTLIAFPAVPGYVVGQKWLGVDVEGWIASDGNFLAQVGSIWWSFAISVDNQVPEPGSLVLLGLGLASLAATRKRKPA